MKIQSGEHQASKENMDWELHKGHGSRTFRETVKFAEPFQVPPTVVVGLTMFDIHAEQNARLMVYVVKAEFNQFTIEYRTWASSRVLEARASWFAYGK